MQFHHHLPFPLPRPLPRPLAVDVVVAVVLVVILVLDEKTPLPRPLAVDVIVDDLVAVVLVLDEKKGTPGCSEKYLFHSFMSPYGEKNNKKIKKLSSLRKMAVEQFKIDFCPYTYTYLIFLNKPIKRAQNWSYNVKSI